MPSSSTFTRSARSSCGDADAARRASSTAGNPVRLPLSTLEEILHSSMAREAR